MQTPCWPPAHLKNVKNVHKKSSGPGWVPGKRLSRKYHRKCGPLLGDVSMRTENKRCNTVTKRDMNCWDNAVSQSVNKAGNLRIKTCQQAVMPAENQGLKLRTRSAEKKRSSSQSALSTCEVRVALTPRDKGNMSPHSSTTFLLAPPSCLELDSSNRGFPCAC